MKKLVPLALTLILTLTLLCAGAFAEAIDHSGDWYADLYGYTLRITLNPDGSYTNAIDGEDPDSGVWEMAGTNVLLDKVQTRMMSLTKLKQNISVLGHIRLRLTQVLHQQLNNYVISY